MKMSQLLKQFNKEYGALLDSADEVSGVREAVDYFETNFEALLPAVQSLVKERGEMLDTSNEKASFLFALESLEGVK